MMARITTAARGSLPPVERSADSSKGKSNDVRAEVASLVSELTNKVLVSQPGNVAQFCADFLEEKLRKREEETKKIGPCVCVFLILVFSIIYDQVNLSVVCNDCSLAKCSILTKL